MWGIKLLKKIKKNIIRGISTIAILGWLIVFHIPTIKSLSVYFVFLGMFAIIWTLLEIKIFLTDRIDRHRYRDLRAAREDIIKKIRACLKKKEDSELIIVAGRIRTVSEMLRGVIDEIKGGEISAKNTKICLYCLQPGYILENFNTDRLKDSTKFLDRFESYDKLIREFTEELDSHNEHPKFKDNNIRIEVKYYCTYPFIYAFLIRNKDIFWGSFTWDSDYEDFVGPPNPCFHYSQNSEDFDFFSSWILSKVKLFDLTD